MTTTTTTSEHPRTDHSRLLHRHCLRARMVCENPVHVGTGSTTDVQATSDMAVARDGQGRPYVPGSSFRGALRSGLEALLLGLQPPGAPWRVCDPLKRQLGQPDTSCSFAIAEKRKDKEGLTEDDAWQLADDGSCEICTLFGHTFLASRVWIADLTLDPENPSVLTYNRDGVGIDRDLRAAAGNILYSFEAVPADTAFELRIDLENAADHEVGLILTGLDLFDKGVIGIGGKRARGLGQVKIKGLEVVRWTAADFFDPDSAGQTLNDTVLKGFRARAREHYMQGGC